MFDRRRFLQLFTAGAVGLVAAEQLALATDIKDWMLSPSKTLFIPPEAKVVVPEYYITSTINQTVHYYNWNGTEGSFQVFYAK